MKGYVLPEDSGSALRTAPAPETRLPPGAALALQSLLAIASWALIITVIRAISQM